MPSSTERFVPSPIGTWVGADFEKTSGKCADESELSSDSELEYNACAFGDLTDDSLSTSTFIEVLEGLDTSVPSVLRFKLCLIRLRAEPL